MIHLRKGQRITYPVHRWVGEEYRRVERRGTVSKIEAERVRVATDFDGCLVWMPRKQIRPL
jgi:hypothetical protein